MQTAILATDLALFFGNKAKLENIVKSGEFSWDVQEHKYAFNMCGPVYCITIQSYTIILMLPDAFIAFISILQEDIVSAHTHNIISLIIPLLLL